MALPISLRRCIAHALAETFEEITESARAPACNKHLDKGNVMIITSEEMKGKESEELLFSYKGVLYPIGLCSAEIFQVLDTIEVRQDDVFLAAYPKCRSNWTQHILNDLINALPNNKEVSQLECIHVLEFEAPEKFQVLVVFRNPKDVAVSYYHFSNKNPGLPNVSSWDEFFQKFMSGEALTYEEMKENLPGGVKQIAEFVGFSLPEEKIQSIAENATFESMSNKSQETHGTLAPMLFRKGDVGDWKNLFTEAQSQEMDAKFKECLAGTKLGAKQKYDKYCKY
ncbi:sulfotransferase 6B1-like [Pangshura tecta]